MTEITADREIPESDGLKSTGDWRPTARLKAAPVFVWPPRPLAFLKYLVSNPGYFMPRNIWYMGLALVTWFYLTPEMAVMKTFQVDWVAWIYGRNLAMMLVVFGGWHYRFYIRKAQGTAYMLNKNLPLGKHRRFLFGDQVWDNMFWTIVSGCTVWTAYEVVTLWAFANEYVPYLHWEDSPVWFVVLFLAIPFMRDAHFYLVHRWLHSRALYRRFHQLHHRNVDINPWSGLAMHPVEHVLYFSAILLHWVVISNPLHAIFTVQSTALVPALAHSGFDKYVLGGKYVLPLGQRYFHFLHHKHFECNYGGEHAVPMDAWFNSFHDGSPEDDDRIQERRKKAFARA